MIGKKVIYLDYAGAAPVDEKVSKAMAKIERNNYANPSAIHKGGVEARKIIEEARKEIASLMFAHEDEIIFTGSGTESDALAILGVVNSFAGKNIPHIVTTNIEHPAVLENCRLLEKLGKAEVTYVEVNEQGIVDPKEIKKALRENTVLVSVMYANNEIGTVQPIMEIAKAVRHFRKERKQNRLTPNPSPDYQRGESSFASTLEKAGDEAFPLLHTDACQAMNYLPTENIEKLGVDLMTFNSSKIYGPKGVGILYKKRSVNLAPIYAGGGQEFDLRSGTENTVSIMATAMALKEINRIKEKEGSRLTKLRDYGIEKLLELSKIPGYEITLNGDEEVRLPNNINISIAGISSELLVIELDAKGIMVSAKSACKADEPDESYVISAIRKAGNKTQNPTDGSIRISLGRGTRKGDIDYLIKSLKSILEKYSKWK